MPRENELFSRPKCRCDGCTNPVEVAYTLLSGKHVFRNKCSKHRKAEARFRKLQASLSETEIQPTITRVESQPAVAVIPPVVESVFTPIPIKSKVVKTVYTPEYEWADDGPEIEYLVDHCGLDYEYLQDTAEHEARSVDLLRKADDDRFDVL